MGPRRVPFGPFRRRLGPNLGPGCHSLRMVTADSAVLCRFRHRFRLALDGLPPGRPRFKCETSLCHVIRRPALEVNPDREKELLK
jgi:hypothetical protein